MNIAFIVMIICVALNLITFFYLRGLIKRRTQASGILPEYRTEVNRLIADIDAATDRDSLLVQERIRKLKEILDDTDKRISVYVKELEKSRNGEALYANLGRGIRAALKTEAPASTGNPNGDFLSLSDVKPNIAVPEPPIVETPPLDSVPVRPKKAPVQTPRKPPSKLEIRSHIDILADEGLSVEEIASRLEISRAEVELAMNLRRG